MSPLNYARGSARPNSFEHQEAIMKPTLFFATDVSMAGYRSLFGAPTWDSSNEPVPTPSPATEIAPPMPFTIQHDEEPAWPAERHFCGNDVY
jgi:hypothetical protein